MGAVRTEDEFELEEHRIDIPIGEEEIFFEEIVIVLQPDFGEFSRIPGEIGADARARLPIHVVGEFGVGHVQVIAAHTRDPSFFESPQ